MTTWSMVEASDTIIGLNFLPRQCLNLDVAPMPTKLINTLF